MKCNVSWKFSLFACLLFLFNVDMSAYAATINWTGAADNLASNPANWSGNLAPQNGDSVVFNESSINATWNLSVTLSSLTKTTGYTGEIRKISGTSLTIGKFVTWTGGGSDNLASNPANWSGNSAPVSGNRILFDNSSSKSCTWNINVLPSMFVLSADYTGTVTLNADLAMTGSLTVSGGTLALNNKALSVDGYLLINPGGTIDATSSTITVKGVWANYGSFIPGTSTVILAGTNQAIYGSTTFCNLTKTTTEADILYFEAGSTQTILCSLTLGGSSGNLLSLRSVLNGQLADGQPWYIDPQGARNIHFVNVRDMHNINFVNIVILPDSEDSGNNTGVSHGGSECVWLEERRLVC